MTPLTRSLASKLGFELDPAFFAARFVAGQDGVAKGVFDGST
jgi:hypothetical protein